MKYNALLLTLFLLGSPHAEKPANDEIRLLMVVDTSFSMRGRRAATTEIISKLITNGFQHAISPGQRFALWTFNEDVDAKFSPTQPWTPELAPNFARAAEQFLRNRSFEQRTRFEVLIPQIRELAENLDSLLVLIFTDGEDRIVGTTLDERLNSSAKGMASEERAAKTPIVFVLTLVDGEFTSATAQRGSRRLSLPQAPTPIPDVVANDAPIKANEPEPKADEPPPIMTYTLPPGAKVITSTVAPENVTEPATSSEQSSIIPPALKAGQREASSAPAIAEPPITPLVSETPPPPSQQPTPIAAAQEPGVEKPSSPVLSPEKKADAPVVNPSPTPQATNTPESSSPQSKESGVLKETVAAKETALISEVSKTIIEGEQAQTPAHTKPFLPKPESRTPATLSKANSSTAIMTSPQVASPKPLEAKNTEPTSASSEKLKTAQIAQPEGMRKPATTNRAPANVYKKPNIPATQAVVQQPLLTTARALIFGGLLAVTALFFLFGLRRRKPTPSLISKSLQSENER
jgi:hypothetical protein